MKKKVVMASLAIMLCLSACVRTNPDVKEPEVSELTESEVENTTEETQEETQEIEEVVEANVPEITYKTEVLSEKAEDGTELVAGTILYPVVSFPQKKEVEDAINGDIQAMLEEFRSYIPETIDAAKEEIKFTQSEDYPFQPFDASVDFATLRNSGNVLSFAKTDYSYTGGAHGNYAMTGINYDLTTGKRITLDQLGSDLESVKSFVSDYVIKQANVASYKNRLNEGFEAYLMDTIWVDGKWYFSNTGVHFYGNPYELGSYAAGIIEFIIPYEEFPGLNENYSYNGNYDRLVPVGAEVTKDINGDGQQDTILFEAIENPEDFVVTPKLTINGKDYSEQLEFENPASDLYAVVDLDKNDNYIELAISQYGASDDLETIFYHLETDATLNEFGRISAIWGDGRGYLKRNALICAQSRLEVVQTWSALFDWQVSVDGIKRIDEGMHYANLSYAETNELLKDIDVYTKMDENGESYVLKASDGPVLLVGSDNYKWLAIQTKDQKEVYVLLKDGQTIVTKSGDLNVNEVFSGLVNAD